MLQNTDALQRAVRESQTRVSKVKLIQDGVVIREVPVSEGRVDADKSAPQQRRFSCTIPVSDFDTELIPFDLDDPTAPFGTDAVIETGCRIPLMVEVTQITDTQPQWNAGTRSGTVGDSNGDLVLGN